MVKLFDFKVWLALLKGSDELQKFAFDEVKKVAQHYYLHTIITAEEKSREIISKLLKNPLVKTFTDILCRQAEHIK